MRLALALLFCVSATAAAQPAALDLGTPLSDDYADGLHPIGWSADGRYLGYVERRSGGGGTVDHFRLVVQDLTSDARVHDQTLTPVESDDRPDLDAEWSRQSGAIQAALDRYGIRVGGSFRLEPLNARPSARVSVSVRLSTRSASGTRSGGPITGLTVTLTNRRGRSKIIHDERFRFERYDAVVIGALLAPSGDRLAVLVETVRGGFESDRTSTYTLVGAGIGARF